MHLFRFSRGRREILYPNKGFVPRACLLLLLCLTVSCGKGREPVHPVRGKVLYHGEPAVHAYVIFHPVAASEAARQMRPHGVVGPDGTFQLKTYRDGDGAPPGDYRVTIEWPGEDPRNPSEPNEPGSMPIGPDRLQGRYANPEASGLRATVVEVENEVTFEIR